jgi:hypothetical protein
MPATEDRTAVGVLGECSNEHCQALAEALTNKSVLFETLSYEDVFYPLRHHHREDLRLRLDVQEPAITAFLKWGAGDFIYRRWASQETWSQVDPFPIFDGIQAGRLDVDVTIVDDEAQEADR